MLRSRLSNHGRRSFSYSAALIEKAWQEKWEKTSRDVKHNASKNDKNRKGFYPLSMFPYPSGNLHMGHVRVYTISDVLARLHKMKGYEVLHPIGWDSFGLPAENAALERNVSPAIWTQKNIASMKKQLKLLGIDFNWSQEISTCDPSYYKLTQKLFLDLYKKDLAYSKKAPVNWDPVDKTVLANEQVDSLGRSWRSGALVEKRLLRQWYFRISGYADELIDDLQKLPLWPESVKKLQTAWIGRSYGMELKFDIINQKGSCVDIFTTRPDTIFGCTFIALAPDHILVNQILESMHDEEHKSTIKNIADKILSQSDLERQVGGDSHTGAFLNCYARNPITNLNVPVYIASYVISSYGSGAIMGVPLHDERDFSFANILKLPLIKVIEGDTDVVTNKGKLINSGVFTGLSSDEASELIIKKAEEFGYGRRKVNYRLRDWLVSRQRYWGCPIPIIHCPKCGTLPVPESQLPILLPELPDEKSIEILRGNVSYDGAEVSPLQRFPSWVKTECHVCGSSEAKRDTDTLDTFVDSSWYFIRYLNPTLSNSYGEREELNKWLPVNLYVGGMEHAILHLLYARFINKFLMKEGHFSSAEPFSQLLTQGMVLAKSYVNSVTGKYLKDSELEHGDNGEVFEKVSKEIVKVSWEKMSKSKYNGVDPTEVISKYGADATRLAMLFAAPPEVCIQWDMSIPKGQLRWIHRIITLVEKCLEAEKTINDISSNDQLSQITRATHLAIKKVSDDLDNHQFNTAVSELMILTNSLSNSIELVHTKEFREGICILIRLLAPMAPHLCSEMWAKLNNEENVFMTTWPIYDAVQLESKTVPFVLQINGKMKQVSVAENSILANDTFITTAASEILKNQLDGKQIIKSIIVKPKNGSNNLIVNFIVR